MRGKAKHPVAPAISYSALAVSQATFASDGPRAFPIKETFRRIGIGHVQGYALIRSGELATFLIGRRRYATAEAITAFLQQRIAEAKETSDDQRRQKVAKATEASLVSRGHRVVV